MSVFAVMWVLRKGYYATYLRKWKSSMHVIYLRLHIRKLYSVTQLLDANDKCSEVKLLHEERNTKLTMNIMKIFVVSRGI